MSVDKASLLALTLPQDSVEVPGLGSVTVRGLSRAEVVRLQGECATPDELENETLAAGMVEPALSVEEAATFRANAPSDVVRAISDPILALSGLGRGQQTEKERRFRPGDD